jgi:ABC-2 type transport system permease protein
VLAAAWFGRLQFDRNLRYDSLAAQATPLKPGAARARGIAERFYRFPGLVFRDPLAGIVEKELRSLARTPRFRMIFVMGFSFGLMLWLPLIIGRNATRHTTFSEYFLTIVCVYALTLLGQVTYWNCFGFDRSAAAIYFAAPLPVSKALLGKNIAHMVYIYLDVAILCIITLALPVQIGRGRVFETVLVTGICSLYMLGMGNLSSVQYPRGLNPERVSQGGASGRFQALVFLLYPLALLPVFLAYLARYAFDSDLVFYIVLAVAASIGGAVYWIATESAIATAGRRREQILQDLSKGEGPVVSD